MQSLAAWRAQSGRVFGWRRCLLGRLQLSPSFEQHRSAWNAPNQSAPRAAHPRRRRGSKGSRPRAAPEAVSQLPCISSLPAPLTPASPLPTTPHAWSSALLLVDKPLSWSSFQVCGAVRGRLARALGVPRPRNLKVGHAGTLDPAATGLLILAVGRATRGVAALQEGEKGYEGIIRLGEGTASMDAATPVEETATWEHVTDHGLEKAVASFLGESLQVPPMYSALKKEGQRLYELARRGETVERAPRKIHVSEFCATRTSTPQDLHYRVRCSKGTYVRVLARDLGEKLGTCAHVTALRRTRSGEYDVRDAWSLETLLRELESMAMGHQESVP